MDRCSESLVIRKMQIKAIMGYCYGTKMTKNLKDWPYQILMRMLRDYNSLALLIEMQNGTATLENSWTVS